MTTTPAEETLPTHEDQEPSPTRPWWASNGYGRLLGGQAVSAVGSQVTFIALPLGYFFGDQA